MGWLSVLLFVPAAFCLSIVAGVIQQLVLKAPVGLTALVAKPVGESFVTVIVSVALIPAIAEELFYRGFVYRAFSARSTASSAIVLSSALFAAAHLNPYHAVPLFALGVVLTLATRASGTLLVPMAVHFAHNAITIVVGHWFGDVGATWGLGMQAAAFVTLSGAGVLLTWAGVKAACRSAARFYPRP